MNENFFKAFAAICSKATKLKAKGRPSGGLLALISKKFDYKILDISPSWIFLVISNNDLKLIIGSIYFRPDEDIENLLESLKNLLMDILEKFEGFKIYIGGDANCRIGSLNNCNIDFFINTFLYETRYSKDTRINLRGEKLVDFMECFGFSAVNGRSIGDSDGNFTYCGANGQSVIDTILVKF